LHDILRIESYSLQEFGRVAADRYLRKLQSGINRIAENPELLRTEMDLHSWLCFYRVEKHLLVCDYNGSSPILVLTVIHSSMDVPSRLMELEPTLVAETELLHRQIDRK
jgi:toxin ParE1/3/4